MRSQYSAAEVVKAAIAAGYGDQREGGVSGEGARVNHGRSMDERGVSAPGSDGTAAGGGSSGGAGSALQPGGSSGGGSSGMRMNTSREAAYADQGALGYSPGGLGALSKLTGARVLPAVFDKEDVQKAAQLAPFWRNLLTFKVPADVVAAVEPRGMRVQTLASGAGDLAIDSYPLLISEFPILSGTRLNAETFVEHVRKNLNNFVDNFWADFQPYSQKNPNDPNPDGADDLQVWQSSNPVKAVFEIDIPIDSGAVVCSARDSTGWIFSIVEAPESGLHPLCGHRGWQIFEVKAGTGVHIFHTMGVDRKSKLAQDPVWAAVNGQRKLWTSFQEKTRDFVNNNGGHAEIMNPEVHAIDWEIVVIELRL